MGYPARPPQVTSLDPLETGQLAIPDYIESPARASRSSLGRYAQNSLSGVSFEKYRF